MDIKEYAAGGYALYEEFAETVTDILEQAIATAGLKASRPQSQYRAKDANRLHARLEEKGQGAATNIEELRKDLAGCRLIFYTNGDLNEFLQSGILGETFDIDYDSTRIHHPAATDGSEPEYRGYNFVGRLKENRASLPEYARFAGLRCEIQLQTILNHAWSETSHDIVYKQPIGTEFAKKALAQIDKRFRDIMRKYLVPAGHEFSKAKHDFESLMQGKPIFEKGPLQALKDAADNNERRDVLQRIQEHYLPNHDDPKPLVPELLATVEEAIDRSRGTPAAKFQGTDFDGWTGDNVVDEALDLLNHIRYADPEATLGLLIKLMKQAATSDEKKHILESVERLAAVPIRVVQTVGGEVQLRLITKLEGLEAVDREAVRPLVLKVCEQILKAELADTSGSYRTVTFERGAVPATKEIEVARKKAIELLKMLYLESGSDIERLVILQHMSGASRTPTQGLYTNDLVKMILGDSLETAAFLGQIMGEASLEVKKAIEGDAWDMFRILGSTPFPDDDDGALGDAQTKLRAVTLAVRDALAADSEYEIFKTLVSLNSVYAPAWETPNFDFRRDDAWRTQRIASYLAGFAPETAEQWWARLERCAASESNDLAAYRGLQEFLGRLCEEKPEFVLPKLDTLTANVAQFLPLILSTLAKSSMKAELPAVLQRWAKEGKHLRVLARHYRLIKEVNIPVLTDVFEMAVKSGKADVVLELVGTLVDTYGNPDKAGKALLLGSIAWLETQGRADWLHEVWFMDNGLGVLAKDLTHDERVVVLKSLVPNPKADYHLEYLLSPFAAVDLPSVLDFFGARLKYASSPPPKQNYDAVPHTLANLKPLRAAPTLVLDAVIAWLGEAPDHWDHEAGSFVHAVFPDMPDELATALIDRATKGRQETRGVLEVLSHYEGAERVFGVCREIVGSVDATDDLLKKVSFVLQQSSTVSGEFGFVQLYIAKKKLLEGWLDDGRHGVAAFAQKEIAALERMIAAEQDRSEQRYALEKLNWGEPLDGVTEES